MTKLVRIILLLVLLPACAATGVENMAKSVVIVTNPSVNGTAAGVIVPGGRVLTVGHAVTDQTELGVEFRDGTKAIAPVVFSSVDPDMAILTIVPPDSAGIASLDCRAPVVGEAVVTIGHPQRIFYLLTVGVVARAAPISDGTVVLDMTSNRGNSGGPVFDANGRVIGIVDGMLSTQPDGQRMDLTTMVGAEQICAAIAALPH